MHNPEYPIQYEGCDLGVNSMEKSRTRDGPQNSEFFLRSQYQHKEDQRSLLHSQTQKTTKRSNLDIPFVEKEDFIALNYNPIAK